MPYKVKLSDDSQSWEVLGEAPIPNDPNNAIDLVPYEKTSSGVYIFTDKANNFILCEPRELNSNLIKNIENFLRNKK